MQERKCEWLLLSKSILKRPYSRKPNSEGMKTENIKNGRQKPAIRKYFAGCLLKM
jgi:hypothetical protein